MYQSLSPPLHCRLTHRIAYVVTAVSGNVSRQIELSCFGRTGRFRFFVPPTPHGSRLLRENCAIHRHRIRDRQSRQNTGPPNHLRGRGAAGADRARTRGPRHGPTRRARPGHGRDRTGDPREHHASRFTPDQWDLTLTAHDSRATPRTVRPVRYGTGDDRPEGRRGETSVARPRRRRRLSLTGTRRAAPRAHERAMDHSRSSQHPRLTENRNTRVHTTSSNETLIGANHQGLSTC